MADERDPVALARRLYSRLIDSGLTGYDDVLDLPDDTTGAGEVAGLLNDRFTAAAAPKAIMIRVGGKDVGVSTPAMIKRAAGYAGPDPGLGSAERSQLPGRSTGYRAIVFSCEKCAARSYQAFYDGRSIPVCPMSGHGPMELVR